MARRFDGFSIGSNGLTRLLASQASPDARVPPSVDSAFVPLPRPRDAAAREHIKPEALVSTTRLKART